MPKINVQGRTQDFSKTEKNEKPKTSNFFITLNTNRVYKDISEDSFKKDVDKLNKSIETILQNIEHYVTLPENHKWDDDHILSEVQADFVVERGAKKGNLHTHVLLRFPKHRTKIQLNYAKIKDKLKSDLSLENVYMYNKLLRPSVNSTILDYLGKYE